MRVFVRLFAAVVLLVPCVLTARADTYEFIVTNFDAYGSYATFDLPSSISNIYQYQGNLFVTNAPVDFTFEPGASVPAYWGNTFRYTATSPVYVSEPSAIGFSDRLDEGVNFAVGPSVGIEQPGYRFYTPITVFQAELPPMFTAAGDTATFQLGTYHGNVDVMIVNATPEPSSFVLLGTGILGVAGMARRRLLSRS